MYFLYFCDSTPAMGKTTLCRAVVALRRPGTTEHIAKDAIWRATPVQSVPGSAYQHRRRVMEAFSAAVVSAAERLARADPGEGLLLVDANLPLGVDALLASVRGALPRIAVHPFSVAFATEASAAGFFQPQRRPAAGLTPSAAWELLLVVALAARRAASAADGGGERDVDGTVESFRKIWASGTVEYAARPRLRLPLWVEAAVTADGLSEVETWAASFLWNTAGAWTGVSWLLGDWKDGPLLRLLLTMAVPERVPALHSAGVLVAALAALSDGAP